MSVATCAEFEISHGMDCLLFCVQLLFHIHDHNKEFIPFRVCLVVSLR